MYELKYIRKMPDHLSYEHKIDCASQSFFLLSVLKNEVCHYLLIVTVAHRAPSDDNT